MATHTLLLSNKGLHDINPVQAGWEHCAPGHACGPGVRPYVLLHYVVSGWGSFAVGGARHQVGAGQLFVIRPYETTWYAASQAQPWHYIWIGFEAGVPLPPALEEDVLALPQAGPVFSQVPGLQGLPAGRETRLCGLIWQLFSLLEGAGVPARRVEDYVNIAKTYMATEYLRGVSVGELARRLNLDRSYFSKVFRQATGRSPQQYLVELRLEKAAELLSRYGRPPGEAALSVGYPDVSSFSRMFRRHYGLSPTEYQNQQKKKEGPPP